MRPTLLKGGAVVAVLGAVFVLGAVWQRFQWPPYSTVHALYVQLKLATVKEASPPGFWSPAPSTDALDEQLHALGYLSGVTEPGDLVGVVRHDPDATMPGVNLYTSGHDSVAMLIDTDGRELHRWGLPFAQAVPVPERDITPFMRSHQYWRRVVLLPDGDLLAMWAGWAIVRLRRDGTVVWTHRAQVHHDMAIAADGSILTLSRGYRDGEVLGRDEPVLDDLLLTLDPRTGQVTRSISILDALSRSPYAPLLAAAPTDEVDFMWDQAPGDVLHTNDLELLDGRVDLPAFDEGHILLSIRHLHALVVLDPASEQVVWSMVGRFRLQHHPTVVDGGGLLLFDNQGPGAYSAVWELDPIGQQTRWSYQGTSDNGFTSARLGAAQRLGNGNTLVSSSEEGRVFEVDPTGRIVWEFYNPARAGEGDKYIAIVPEMVRLPRPDWL